MSLKYACFLLLFLFLSACKNEPRETEKPLYFDSISVIKKSGAGCLSDEFDCTLISIRIPEAQGPKSISEKINAVLKSHVFALAFAEGPSTALSYEEYAKEFIANQQQAAAEFQETAPWNAVVAGKVLLEKENLISIAVDSEIFTGGAHGYRSISFFNFNPETGDLLKHEDIFTPEFLGYAEQAFRVQFDIPKEEPINSTGLWFENDSFSLPQNIGFEEDNIILIYNIYEVASYSEGDFRLEIPIDTIEEYLKLDLSSEEEEL